MKRITLALRVLIALLVLLLAIVIIGRYAFLRHYHVPWWLM